MEDEKKAIERLPAQVTAEILAGEESVFLNVARFEHAQRVARVLAESTMVPQHFQKNTGNCIIALNLAQRLEVDVFMLMQSLYIVHGRPGIEGKLVIALVAGNGRFGHLQYKFEGNGKTEKGVERPGKCIASAKDLKSGQIIEGPPVTWEMAVAEGWTKGKSFRDGSGEMPSKWQTIPQLMFMYRAATFFARVHCPGALFGLKTSEELEDMQLVDITPKKGGNGEKEVTDNSRQEALDKFRNSLPLFMPIGEAHLQAFLSLLAKANRCTEEDVKVQAAENLEAFWKGFKEYEQGQKTPDPPSGDPPQADPTPAPDHAAADAAISDADRKREQKIAEKRGRNKPPQEMVECPEYGKHHGRQVAVIYCQTQCDNKRCTLSPARERQPGDDDE